MANWEDMDLPARRRAYAKIIAKAWHERNFKRDLLENPMETLLAEGWVIPAGVRVIAHETTSDEWHLVIPLEPRIGPQEMREEVAGFCGTCDFCSWTGPVQGT